MIKELMEIQQKLKCPKNQFNSFGKYNFRSCEDILESVKPLLAENECVLTLSDDIIAVGDRIYVKATAILTKGDQEIGVTAYAREEETKKGMDASQITGTASSYARKYALNGLFCIDDVKDSDATNMHGKDGKGKQQTAANSEPGTITAEQMVTIHDWTESQREWALKSAQKLMNGLDVQKISDFSEAVAQTLIEKFKKAEGRK